jgi:hypothetical protein
MIPIAKEKAGASGAKPADDCATNCRPGPKFPVLHAPNAPVPEPEIAASTRAVCRIPLFLSLLRHLSVFFKREHKPGNPPTAYYKLLRSSTGRSTELK